MRKSIGPMRLRGRGREPPPVGRPRSPAKGRDGRCAPRSSSAMSFQLAIPRRVALQQSPPPLHQPPPSMRWELSVGNELSANGNLSLIIVSQAWGAVQPESSTSPKCGRGRSRLRIQSNPRISSDACKHAAPEPSHLTPRTGRSRQYPATPRGPLACNVLKALLIKEKPEYAMPAKGTVASVPHAISASSSCQAVPRVGIANRRGPGRPAPFFIPRPSRAARPACTSRRIRRRCGTARRVSPDSRTAAG
jgi:hypothetical protein